MSNEILLTGANGYIGSYLFKTWLERTDQRINLLLRGKRGLSPEMRIESAMQEIEPSWSLSTFDNRLRILEGDVSLDHFGLESGLYTMLQNEISEIIHCAAAARFDLPLEEARRTNVGGVEAILDLGSHCTNLKRIDYVGTAYVSGMRSGCILESELVSGQQHRNTYEQSKYEAETLIRSWMTRLPITVSRPSIVICDSKTGKASSHNGFYRAVKAYVHRGLTLLPGASSSMLDLVPVDYVCEALFRITRFSGSVGQTYHLTAGDQAINLGDIQQMSAQYANLPAFKIVSRSKFQKFTESIMRTLSEEQIRVFGEMQKYEPYLFSQAIYDNSNCFRVTDVVVPAVRDYYERFIRSIQNE